MLSIRPSGASYLATRRAASALALEASSPPAGRLADGTVIQTLRLSVHFNHFPHRSRGGRNELRPYIREEIARAVIHESASAKTGIAARSRSPSPSPLKERGSGGEVALPRDKQKNH